MFCSQVNRYKVKCGVTLGKEDEFGQFAWEQKGWIEDSDPFGWFQASDGLRALATQVVSFIVVARAPALYCDAALLKSALRMPDRCDMLCCRVRTDLARTHSHTHVFTKRNKRRDTAAVEYFSKRTLDIRCQALQKLFQIQSKAKFLMFTVCLDMCCEASNEFQDSI